MCYQKTNIQPFVQTEYSLISSQILSSGPNFGPLFIAVLNRVVFIKIFETKIFLKIHDVMTTWFCKLHLQTVCFLYRNFLRLGHYIVLYNIVIDSPSRHKYIRKWSMTFVRPSVDNDAGVHHHRLYNNRVTLGGTVIFNFETMFLVGSNGFGVKVKDPSSVQQI